VRKISSGTFMPNEENPVVTDEMVEMFRKAKEIYKKNRF